RGRHAHACRVGSGLGPRAGRPMGHASDSSPRVAPGDRARGCRAGAGPSALRARRPLRMTERTPNYVTREGARKLQEELANLRSSQRPKVVQEVADAAAQGDRSENAEYIYGKRKLREIDRRIHWLTKRLESATVVEPRTDG